MKNDLGETTGKVLQRVHIQCRMLSFWTMILLGLMDVGAIAVLADIPGGMPIVLAPSLLLLLFAVWMFLQAWGYWILTVEAGDDGLHILAPHERCGVFLPPAQELICRWSEVEKLETPVRNRARIPGTGMLLRMPTDTLIISAKGRQPLRLTYSMVKNQIHEIAALIGEKTHLRAT
jgi:hypothetical protein